MVELVGDLVGQLAEILGDAVPDLLDFRPRVGDGGDQLLVELVALEELADGALAVLDRLGHVLQVGDQLTQVLAVLVDKFAHHFQARLRLDRQLFRQDFGRPA